MTNLSGYTLLHKAILDGDSKTALLLLEHGADVNVRTREENDHPLHMAITNKLPKVVDGLCKRGVDMSVQNKDGACPLWAALKSEQMDVAEVLVKNGVDTDSWGPGPDGCTQTLLHTAIDDNLQDAAIFLITTGCDINSPQRYSILQFQLVCC